MRNAGGYDVFISYSHADDSVLAATLQAGLERFSKPWYRSRVLRVFRDTTNLTAAPGLWSEITRALEVSDWFVLIASPKAARSAWVRQEVAWWLANKDRDKFLIAVSAGTINWGTDDFDWQCTDALPRELSGVFSEVPLWVDLHSIRETLASTTAGIAEPTGSRRLLRRHVREQIGDWVADLAAPIHHKPKDALVGEHVHQQRRTRHIVQAAASVLSALTLVASAAAVIAVNQRDQARTQARIATSRELATLSQTLLPTNFDLGQLFAAEAYHLDANPQTRASLFQAVSASPHLVMDLQANDPVSAVAGSADGQVVVAGTANGQLLRWKLPGTRPTVIARIKGAVTSVALNANGGAATAISETAAVLWTSAGGVRALSVPPAQEPTAAGISPSGDLAALGSVPKKAPYGTHFDLALFDSQARPLTRVTKAEGSPSQISFPNESALVTFDSSGAWQRLSVPALKRIAGYVIGFGVHSYASALSPGGEFFSSTNGGSTLPVWTAAGAPTDFFHPPLFAQTRGYNPTALAISRNGNRIAQADTGVIYVADVAAAGKTAAAPIALTGNDTVNPGSLTFIGPGDDHLLSASGDLLTLWNLSQYSRIATEASIYAPIPCFACGGPQLAIRPDGKQVAVVDGMEQSVTVQDLDPLPGRRTVLRGSNYGPPLWSPDSRRLLLINPGNGAGETLSTAAGLPITDDWPKPPPPPASSQASYDEPESMSMSRDGAHIIEIDYSGAVKVRNALTGKIERQIAGPAAIEPAVLLPSIAASDTDAKVGAVIDFSHDSKVFTVTIATGRIHMLPGGSAIGIGFNGEQLLVQRPSGVLQIWNDDGTRMIRSVSGDSNDTVGPVANQHGWAAEESSDGTAVLTDLVSGDTIGTLPLPHGLLDNSTGMAFTPNGESLITVTEAAANPNSDIGEIVNWQLSDHAWMNIACTSAGHTLTAQEWEQNVGTPVPQDLACAQRR